MKQATDRQAVWETRMPCDPEDLASSLSVLQAAAARMGPDGITRKARSFKIERNKAIGGERLEDTISTKPQLACPIIFRRLTLSMVI